MNIKVANAKILAKNFLIKALYNTNTKSVDFAKSSGTHKTDIAKMISEDCLSNNVKLYQLLLEPQVFKYISDLALNHFGEFTGSNINGTLSDECQALMVAQGNFIKEFESGHVSQKTMDNFQKAVNDMLSEAKAQRG